MSSATPSTRSDTVNEERPDRAGHDEHFADEFSYVPLIQEFAARLLAADVGRYGHHVGSMHLNQLDLPKAQAVLDDDPPRRFTPAAMPAPTGWNDIRTVLEWEQALRRNEIAFSVTPSGLDPNWTQVVGPFEVYREITHQTD